MTAAKSIERALRELQDAMDRNANFPVQGVRSFLITAQTGAEAAARLLETPLRFEGKPR